MDPILELLTKGSAGVVLAVFAFLLWRANDARAKEAREDAQKRDAAIAAELAKQTAMLGRIVERVIRIDDRTHRMGGGRERLKTPTPFFPLKQPPDDKEE